MPDASSVLASWSSFYVMTGSSAAALTGLMFIVITLVTGSQRLKKSNDGISTFSTPTVMHFASALLVSAVLVAPWPALLGPAVALSAAGLFGIAYVISLIARTRTLTEYNADAEDWVWYNVAPLCAYAALLSGAIALPLWPRVAMFVIAAGALLLVFLGIRNAWDVVTFIALNEQDAPPP